MDTMNDTEPPTDTDPPRSGPYRRPDRLSRASDDKVLGGVAGGLGRYFGLDPIVFRIAFVVLALAGGSGVLLYGLAWLLVPDDAGAVALPRLGHERNQKLLAAVLAGGGLLLLLRQLTNRGNGDVPAGIVLVAIGALVLWSRRDHHDGGLPPTSGGGGGRYPGAIPTPPAPTETAAEPAETIPGDGGAEAHGEPPLATDDTRPMATAPMGAVPTLRPPPVPRAPTAPKPPKAPKAPKPRSSLVPVTLSLLAVLAGGLTLVGVSAVTGLALALLLTGGALVVGAWRGRARWLIPIGLILAIALAAASIIDVPVRGGTGGRTFRPTTLADVRSPYRLAAGNLTLDLGALDLAGTTVTVVASVAAGQLQVVVPSGVVVDIDAHAGAGDLDVLGRHDDGLDAARQVSEPGDPAAGHLIVRARVGAGHVEVRRAAA